MMNGRPRGTDSSRPCRLFAVGKCHYGSRCRFSHNGTSQSYSQASPDRRQAPASPAAVKLREWKFLLPKSPTHVQPLGVRLASFFMSALGLLDGDIDVAQVVIKSLAAEGGLCRIKELVDDEIGQTAGPARGILWESKLKVLFNIVTHPHAANSSTLENEVATIYNVLLGYDGTRMERIFSFILFLLRDWNQVRFSSTSVSIEECIELSILVLLKMINFNTAVIVNDKVHDVAGKLSRHLDSMPDADNFYLLQARAHFAYLQRRLNIAKGLPVPETNVAAPAPRATFILRKDLPGSLSSLGPRHSNDHADISKIRILPPFDEVLSLRSEYRPFVDQAQWHLPDIAGLVDRHFRLIREDTIGQLRDAVRAEVDNLKGTQVNPSGQSQGNSIKVYSYSNVLVNGIDFSSRDGFIFTVNLEHPAPAQRLDPQKRKEWWSRSKRLQDGALVCLVDTASVVFCSVVDMPMRQPRDKSSRDTVPQNTDSVTIRLRLAEPSEDDIEQEFIRYARRDFIRPRSLVEFPGILLDSFKLTLEALQQMSQTLDLPFPQFLAPPLALSDSPVNRPPVYAMKPGFRYNLRPLCLDGLDMRYSPRDPLDPRELAARSTLDEAQARALLNCLRRGFALVQGPPGTGKSYTGESLIKVLLASKEAAKLGPIICVCYTNHALDQLLEHLWHQGTKQIVRIGSRSKSEVLQDVNLSAIAPSEDRSKVEKHTLWVQRKDLKKCEEDITQGTQRLLQAGNQATIMRYLEARHPTFHQFFFPTADEDGFVMANSRRRNLLTAWLRGGAKAPIPPRPLQVLQYLRPDLMTNPERRFLYDYWIQEAAKDVLPTLRTNYVAARAHTAAITKVRRDIDLRCLQQADVIGVTTTGLARNLELLRRTNSKVLVCEEAGEVLEGHLLTALLPSIEHAILIGDHLQLRPQIQNYELQSTNPRGEPYSLDVSLFERLVQPITHGAVALEFDTLDLQRRMHPSIAELVRSTLYPDLKDFPSVSEYPEVAGMRRRLYWMDHSHYEAHASSTQAIDTSHSNDWEINFVTALVTHLVRQGTYEKDDIALITPYLGQLHKLRHKLSRTFEIVLGDRDVADLEKQGLEELSDELHPVRKESLQRCLRLATVDNFQGEEAKVVIISLVRSNDQNKCGFLRTFNRINVLLSRAKHGMYIIGNSKTYGGVGMWRQVLEILESGGNLGPQLELQCPRHPNIPILVSEPDHFAQYSPEGGCQQPCDKRLDCGHSCISRCHSEVIHKAVKCLEPCPRPRKGCYHPCLKLCGEPCEPKCTVTLKDEKLKLKCGHEILDPKCWQSQEPDKVVCKAKVYRQVPRCSHMVTVNCYVDVASEGFACPAECQASLPCGHNCKSSCTVCHPKTETKVKVSHGTCRAICGRPYPTCKHTCSQVCHSGTPCKPCAEPCDVKCSHSRCQKKCHEPCVPCAETRCASICPHSHCSMPCAAPCDWIPCSRRCTQNLSCGHQCPSVCGENCPTARLCQICGTDDAKAIVADMLEFKTYGDVNLDEDPCIFPACGHIFTMSTLDGIMSMHDNYVISPDGQITAIKAASRPLTDEKHEIKGCPTCRGSLRDISRYGRIVRRALLWESNQKFMGWLNAEYLKLDTLLEQAETALSEAGRTQPLLEKFANEVTFEPPLGRSPQLQKLGEFLGENRYGRILSVRGQINKYLRKARVEEQPFQKVYDHVQYARRQQITTSTFAFDQSVTQVKGLILGMSLLLRCDVTVLTDFRALRDRANDIKATIKLNLNSYLRDCEDLIKRAKEKMYPKHQVEGHVFFARLCGIARKFPNSAPPDKGLELYSQVTSPRSTIPTPGASSSDIGSKYNLLGMNHITLARQLVSQHPACEVLVPEIDAAERGLSGTFYQPVTEEEKRAIALAMQTQFRGSGHWYTCARGHPFTVGECGMPMEEARCPECGSPVGGHDHRPVAGVRSTNEFDSLTYGVGRMTL